ncbi:MAG TPA: fumarylacetoacetate hydrolase family protein [Thermoanaerobaculia bacterium]|nr:fumarylacetoacetate hydrolase family protein [Thermoanaerobaculia bacterium]
MLLYRLGPEGRWAAGDDADSLRVLYSEPFETPPEAWELGNDVDPAQMRPLAPLAPGKIVGIGRNYLEHAKELGNEMPAEPLIFLKAISSLAGPQQPIVLPPESADVHFEGEVAIVIGKSARRVSAREARAAIFGWSAACDVTARDLQNKDKTFARAKSFDSFCPLGPAIRLGVPDDDVTVVTRVDGKERQRGRVGEMAWGPVALVEFVSRFITLEPGDLVLTGTPSGVGTLHAGERVEVEVSGVGVLSNPVESWNG